MEEADGEENQLSQYAKPTSYKSCSVCLQCHRTKTELFHYYLDRKLSLLNNASRRETELFVYNLDRKLSERNNAMRSRTELFIYNLDS